MAATCCASRRPIPTIDDENTSEAIRRTTRAYNAALERLVLRHPEQWYWVHRRWKRRAAPRSCVERKLR